MTSGDLQNPPPAPDKLWESRTYVYYSRYPEPRSATNLVGNRWIRRISIYIRLVFIGVIMVIAGGVLPLWLSYEFFFRPILNIACSTCQIMNDQSYFTVNYVIATALGIFGLMMPIFVLYIFIRIIRSQTLRQDLFY